MGADDLAVTMTRDELRQLVIDALREMGREPNNDGAAFVALTYEQAAERVGVHEATIRKWVRDEGLPMVDLGGNVHRVLESDLLAWMVERRGKRAGKGRAGKGLRVV